MRSVGREVEGEWGSEMPGDLVLKLMLPKIKKFLLITSKKIS